MLHSCTARATCCGKYIKLRFKHLEESHALLRERRQVGMPWRKQLRAGSGNSVSGDGATVLRGHGRSASSILPPPVDSHKLAEPRQES